MRSRKRLTHRTPTSRIEHMSTVDSQVTESSGTLSAGQLADWVTQLSDVGTNAPDPELIDQIRELERIKSACAAALQPSAISLGEAILDVVIGGGFTDDCTQTTKTEFRAV